MATVPIDGTRGTQVAVTELNDEIRSLRQQLSRFSVEGLQKDIETLQGTVDAIEHRRRIPERGHRAAGSPLGLLFLNDNLFWSSPTAQAFVVTITFVSTSTVLTSSDNNYIILVNATGGNVTITLPPAVAQAGRIIEIKKIDSTINRVILAAAGTDLIDGFGTLELLVQYEAVPVVSDGSAAWWVL